MLEFKEGGTLRAELPVVAGSCIFGKIYPELLADLKGGLLAGGGFIAFGQGRTSGASME